MSAHDASEYDLAMEKLKRARKEEEKSLGRILTTTELEKLMAKLNLDSLSKNALRS